MAATMKDIAQKTGLGLATISKYFNDGKVRPNNRLLIENAVKELHFIPNGVARSLRTNRSRSIGIVIPELSNTFITSIISSVEDILRSHDYSVIVCDCRSNSQLEKEAVLFLVHKRIDGLINMPTDMTGAHLSDALASGTPIVLVDRLISPMPECVSAVVVDNVAAAQQGTQYLLDHGHRRIGLILGTQGLYTTEKRYEGYLNALRTTGVPLNRANIQYGDYTIHGGYTATKLLMSLPDMPSSIFVTNYEMTLGTILALNEMHINIPQDLSLFGFDKLDLFGTVYPHLATIRQPHQEIAQSAADQIMSLMSKKQGPAMNNVITLNAQLCPGETVIHSCRHNL